MKFVKMHGCGNDYVYLDGVTEPALAMRIEREDWSALVRRMSDRHKGIGSDGVIVLCPPTQAAMSAGASVRMRMFNGDGSEAEMCGNGARCVAKFAHDRLGITANPMLVETGRGVLSIAYETDGGKAVRATVDMGEPILELERVPVDRAHVRARGAAAHELVGADDLKDWTFVSMGNPHAVAWDESRPQEYWGTRESMAEMIRAAGPGLEVHPAFPNRANIHLVRNADRSHAEVFTWERGAGVTQACGTGACAALVAGVLNGRLEREATIRVLGGELSVRWDEGTNHVFMTGEAVDVFEGEWPEESIATGAAHAITPVTLRTERLLLRPFAMEDAPELQRYLAERAISGMTATIPHPYTMRDATDWLRKVEGLRASGKAAVLAICQPGAGAGGGGPGGTLVGAIGLSIDPAHQRAEMGYWIGVPHWGRGYATEAARAMLDYAFGTLKLRRIFACHFAKNQRSGHVLEKIGLNSEGVSPGHTLKWGEPQDVAHFGLLREEWLTRPGHREGA